ncbi:MAG: hypothetical protein LKJ22_08665 [Liquorilactobacillus nagelii]|uniref:hypothetical protein n=1 Tax=Liquorilactobacillus nagelii TaxID=82688 RepID=UPI00242D7352|nr:hypothetical protein [Liquorilactobacillus nagelii]MCI1921979.1 hypothetical protein [Liquorilactobacillus nagelii]MCI1976373.1 hypothetical protein [Liquorilactobacillus nagelii]
MAKTLIYAAGSPASVKIGDTDTDLYLQVAKDNVAVDLTVVTSITVKIADANKNYLKDISVSPSSLPDGDKGILVVPLNSGNISGLNSGDYYFEVWIVTTGGDSEIYPDMNVTKFHVFNNIVGGTTVLTTLTMQAFLDRITSTQNNSEIVLQAAQAELQNMDTAFNNANKALNDLKNGNYLTKDTLSSAPSFESLQTQVNNSAVGTNLIVGSATLSGASMDNNGEDTGFPTTFITDYIEVVAGENYTISTTLSESRSRVAFYDNSKTFMSRLADQKISNTLPQTITIPTGASFIRFSPDEDNGKYENNFKLEKGSFATDQSINPTEILTKSDYAKIQAAIVALGGSLS